jgi:kumamolisin
MFTSILDDGRAKVLNYSWGNCEDDLTPDHKDAMVAVYERAVAQGVNIFVASGDSGSDSCGNGRTQADWPAANGSIVAVGGTSFSDDGGTLSEDGWDGSGGGISTMFDLPDYQKNLGGIFVKRSYPDVAFNANPYTGQAIYTGSPASWQVVGGTSMAAPQWAGFMALVNAARASDNKGALGFLNPVLYSMSQREQKACMHDITDGNNGAYSAQVGWDAVTGFGSMQADQLLAYLRKQ